MKKIIPITLVGILILSGLGTATPIYGSLGKLDSSLDKSLMLPPGTHLKFMFFDGEIRSYRIHIPTGYDSSNPVPLVFNFHGTPGGSLTQMLCSEFNNSHLLNDNVNNFLKNKLFNEKTNNIESLFASTFLGGGSNDRRFVGIVSDVDGNVFVTGTTWSADFPTTTNAYDNSYNGGSDIFVSKFNADLTQLISSTFIGGADDDETNRRCITIDSESNILVTGTTNSNNFPVTENTYDNTYNGNKDIFLIKLTNDLTTLLNSTFIGGNYGEGHRCDVSIDINQHDDIYISGMTGSYNFPTTQNAYSDSYFGGNSDFFIAKFDKNISSLKSSTFFGGSESEEWAHVFLDDDDNVFVGGFTSSSNLPTTDGAYDEIFNGIEDTFVAKLNSDLSNLIACTYVGGRGYDNCYTSNIDNDGNILLGGHADYGYPTTPGVFRRFTIFPFRGFISKMSGDLSSLIASTFIAGGLHGAYCSSIDSDIHGNIFVSGYTRAFLFKTTQNGFDKTYNGGVDIFISKFDQDLSTLEYSTYIGGSGDDELGSAILVNEDGTLYLSSGTTSADFPTTTNAYDNSYNGEGDCFIVKMDCS